MRIVVLAYHDVGCACLQVLLDAGQDICALFTHEDDPEEGAWFGSVARLARAHGIPVHTPENINEPESIDTIRDLAPDIIFSFYYRRLVGSEILDIPLRGAMNLHGSLLPHYRGRSPLNWVLLRGEPETGVTLHYMVRRADAGPIVAQSRLSIGEHETAPELHARITVESAALLERVLPAIREGNNPRIEQDLRSGSYFGGRRPEDGRIDWTRPAVEIHNLVRAVTRPWPGAFTACGDRKLFVWRASPDDAESASPAGRILPGPGLRVAAGRGVLRVLRAQFEGGPDHSGEALVSEGSIRRGEILGQGPAHRED